MRLIALIVLSFSINETLTAAEDKQGRPTSDIRCELDRSVVQTNGCATLVLRGGSARSGQCELRFDDGPWAPLLCWGPCWTEPDVTLILLWARNAVRQSGPAIGPPPRFHAQVESDIDSPTDDRFATAIREHMRTMVRARENAIKRLKEVKAASRS